MRQLLGRFLGLTSVASGGAFLCPVGVDASHYHGYSHAMETTANIRPSSVFSETWAMWPEEFKTYLTLGLLADEEGCWRGNVRSLVGLLSIDPDHTSTESVIERLVDAGYLEIVDAGILVKDPEGIFKRRTRTQVLNAERVRKHRAKKAGK
jgi:hypothetical protein